MKKALLFAVLIFAIAAQAQEIKPIPQVSVSGEGKVKVIPDEAFISISVENKGNNATDVKKQNDEDVEKVVRYIRQTKLAKEDVQTRRVSLSPQYDYDRKKYTYIASQTIEILLRDLSQYDAIMAGLTDSGINRINNVEFRSSQLARYQSDARKLAIAEARHKAEDYVSVLAQKVGKAFTITDNTQVNYPQPITYMMKSADASAEASPRQTLALGEIDVTANVSVSFILE